MIGNIVRNTKKICSMGIMAAGMTSAWNFRNADLRLL